MEITEEEKKKAIKDLRERATAAFELTPKQSEYMTDVSLDIHLRARKYDMDKSFQILSESLKWVREHEELLTNLRCPQCAEDPSQHYFKPMGFDDKNRPVIYTTAGCYFDITLKHSYEHNIIAFENLIKSMPAGTERFVYVADLFNMGLSKIDLKSNIAFFRTIQAPYRGRLGQIVLIDPPSAIWVGLRLIKPFLKPETLEKVMFVNTSDLEETLTPILGQDATQRIIQEVQENHNKEVALQKKWWE
jgi:hypothetical protein